ncbi:MAG: hypothetical protein WBY44_20345 [Bryobacteraceae bacterium]
MKLFGFGGTRSKPEARLRAGVATIATVLAPHGFRFLVRESGNSSGGPFAFGEFVRGDRRLELHVRDSLGLVRYHLGSHSASHEYYMKELGEWPRCDYPGFPNDPMDPFERLAHDLKFAGEFMSGDARLLLRASEIERAALAARDARDFQGYVGDIRTLKRMRNAFRLGAYDEVVELAGAIRLPDKMTDTQRRMVEIAKAKIH